MQSKFIIDKEINLNESDFLKTKIYADNLSKIIRNAEANKVFTIGVFGNWGTGKSSIVKTSNEYFEGENNKDENKNKKIKFITYDAWQYVNDSFRRMFLRKLREDLLYEETDLMSSFYENESTDVGNKYQLSPTRLAIILGGLILILGVLTFIPFNIEYKVPIYAIFTLLGLLITIISGAFHQLKISVTKPHFFAPEQFEECFKEIVSNSLSKKTNRILKWVKGDKSIQGLEKLIIVIDNIDRCSNDVAYNLLTDIKTFISSEPYSIIFVIPVDDEALKKHIIKNSITGTDCDKEKEEFLRKFFNVTIRIKPYSETDMYSFAKKICVQSGLNFKPETINIASKEYATNPRRIIQLFNNLLAEINYYEVEFIQKNETLICATLIIREEYPDYYKSIVNSPKIFNEEYTGENEKIKRFVRIAHTALSEVSISDLSMILTNSHHHFDSIATDIKDAINTFDVEKVLTVWENEKEQITNYIFDKLDNSVRNGLIETELVAYFDLITQINNSFPIEKHIAKRIDERILPYLSIIIVKTKNHVNLCKYGLLREKQKDIKIKSALIKESERSENQPKDTSWKNLFNAVLKTFQDKKTSIELSLTYTDYNNNVEFADFSAEQFEYLLSNRYVKDKISDLPKNDIGEPLLDIHTNEYRKVRWLFENKQNIDEETYGHFFANIIGSNNDENRMRGKNMEEIMNLLQFIQPCLILIPDRKLTTIWEESGIAIPTTLYGLIVNDRQVPKPQYVNNENILTQAQYFNSNYYITANFIDECVEAESNIQTIIDFVINIYRITDNKTDVTSVLEKLLTKYRDLLNIEFLKLVNERKFTLLPILNQIFDDNSYENFNTVELLKYCFNEKSNDKFQISEDKSKTKLNDLLMFAQKEQSIEVFALLESLIKEERYKTILSNLIIEKDCDFINSLPEKFLKLAVGNFNRSSSPSFADNFNFLKVIILHGSNTQKGYIVTILITKLDNNENIEQVLDLIDVMENVASFDQSGLLHSHLDKYLRDNKEELEDELVKKLKQAKSKTKLK